MDYEEKDLRLAHFTIERAADAIMWIDANGRIQRVNEAACAYLGYTRDELLGMSVPDIDPDYDAKKWHLHWQEIKSHRSLTLESLHYTKDGKSVPVEITNNFIEFEGNEYTCTFVHDISGRKRDDEKLRSALTEVERLKNRLAEENIYLQNEIKREHNFDEIVCYGPAMKTVLQKVEQVADTDSTVLILGETGTGKELVARALHNVSSRRNRPLVKVNCAALPENLIESELFGHEKGAFTGAIQRKIGRFELADGGTIFLDEIGDLPLILQSKLLRVLQEGQFERLGDSRTITVDTRVIAATNRELEKAVEAKDFRIDLYYRLNVFPVLIPPLRDRREDIPLLVKYFVMKSVEKTGKKITSIPQDTIDKLQAYSWPGNVRELENFIERAVILSNGGVLQLDDMPHCPVIHASPPPSLSLNECERQHILSVLQSTNWRVSGEKGAAKILNVKPTTLEAKMKRLGITRPGK
jgi:PAS domain S-box-containing protein